MFAFPEMLRPAATAANIAVPDNTDTFDPNEFPHFFVFKRMQLGAPMPHSGVAFDNARVIASFTADGIKSATARDVIAAGFDIGHPLP